MRTIAEYRRQRGWEYKLGLLDSLQEAGSRAGNLVGV